MRTREVVERQIVFEYLADFDDIFFARGFAGSADFAEEFLEFLFFGADGADRQPGLAEGVPEEGGDLLAGVAEAGGFVFAGFLAFVGGGEEVGEEFEGHGEEQFGEGDDDEDGKGDEAAEILDCALELNDVSTEMSYGRGKQTCLFSRLLNS